MWPLPSYFAGLVSCRAAPHQGPPPLTESPAAPCPSSRPPPGLSPAHPALIVTAAGRRLPGERHLLLAPAPPARPHPAANTRPPSGGGGSGAGRRLRREPPEGSFTLRCGRQHPVDGAPEQREAGPQGAEGTGGDTPRHPSARGGTAPGPRRLFLLRASGRCAAAGSGAFPVSAGL